MSHDRGLLARARRSWATSALPMRGLLTAVVTANFLLLAVVLAGFLVSDVGYDWLIFVEAGDRVGGPDLYRWEGDYTWIYSPLLAYLFQPLSLIGYWGWFALHFLALGLLKDRLLAAITLFSFPFWVDVYNGNTMTFVFVAAASAVRGRPVGVAVYLGLCLLMPRPLLVPLAVWLLWQRGEWRAPFAMLCAVSLVLVAASGYFWPWAQALLNVRDFVADASRDIGPANVLGAWWVPIGLVIAVVLTSRGRLGLASLAASPYWLPQYLLMLLIDFARGGVTPVTVQPCSQAKSTAGRRSR